LLALSGASYNSYSKKFAGHPPLQGQKSMPASTIVCPECQTVLKSANPVPPGKKIKCPKCATLFSPLSEEEEEQGSYAFQADAKPAAPPPPRKKPKKNTDEDEDEDEEPVSRNGRGKALRFRRGEKADDRDQYEDDDELDEEEEERPRAKPQRKFKKAPKKGGAGVVIAFVLGGTLLFLLAGSAVFLFLWLNWDKNRGSGEEDLLAYVPGDSQVIAGIDWGTIMSQPDLASGLNAFKKDESYRLADNCCKQTGLEYKDLFDHAVYALKPPAPNPRSGVSNNLTTATRITRSKVPFSQSKIRKAADGPVRKTFQGKTYFQINETPFTRLFTPSDRTIVVSTVNDGQMEAIIGTEGSKPALPANTLTMMRGIQQDHLWAFVPMENWKASAFMLPLMAAQGEGAAELKKIHALSFRANLAGDKVKVAIAMHCTDNETASKVAEGFQNVWEQQVKGFAGLGLAGVPQDLRPLFEEFIQNAQISSQGPAAQLTCEVSRASITTAMKEFQKQQQRYFQQLEQFGS
jgi:phage FluMu protein Com